MLARVYDRYPRSMSTETGQICLLSVRFCYSKRRLQRSFWGKHIEQQTMKTRIEIQNIPTTYSGVKSPQIGRPRSDSADAMRSEEHTSELQSHHDLVCRLLLEKKKK